MILKKNKAVLIFLLRFFVSYIALSSGYNWFLGNTQQTEDVFVSDPITRLVAEQTVTTARFLGLDFRTEQHPEELSYKLISNNNYVARVVEGCNSISIIVLFWAFIIAFKGRTKNTLLFGIMGGLSIYLLNILRIVLLTYAVDKYPSQTDFLHHIVFPGIIYGFTFVLWFVWVKHFAITPKKVEDE